MYGAFTGDIVGSKYEFHNIKTKEFPLFSSGCDYTDDTIMTVAAARAIMDSCQERSEKGLHDGKTFQELFAAHMRELGRRYPYPTGAYGGRFSQWLREENPQPYGSYGNGSAMRVSACGLAAVTLTEAIALGRASAMVTHNHPEGIKGAEAVAAAVFLAKTGKSKEEIGAYIREHYYPLDFTLDEIRTTYSFQGSCQKSVPQAIEAFLESESFEDAIRNVISIGGDVDTTGAITGSIAWTYYKVQQSADGWKAGKLPLDLQEIRERVEQYLPEEFRETAEQFREFCLARTGAYERNGWCEGILTEQEEQQMIGENDNL